MIIILVSHTGLLSLLSTEFFLFHTDTDFSSMPQMTQRNGASTGRTQARTGKGQGAISQIHQDKGGRPVTDTSRPAKRLLTRHRTQMITRPPPACYVKKNFQKHPTTPSSVNAATQLICQSCTNLDNEEYKFLTSRPQFHCYCIPFESDAMQAIKNEALIAERCQEFLSKYEKKMDDIEDRVNTKADIAKEDYLSTSVQVLNDQVKHLATDISRLNQKIESMRFEPVEKTKRKNNIVIRGVPESEDLTDTERIKEILDKIGCGNITPTEITRLGKRHANRN